MADLVKKKVLGTGTIPKFNMRPPLVICETEDFFNQLVAMGFKVEELEEKKEEKATESIENDVKKDDLIVSDNVSINIIGGKKYELEKDMSATFESTSEDDKSIYVVNEEKKEEKTVAAESKSNKKIKKK